MGAKIESTAKKHRCTKACKFHAAMKAKLARRAVREQQRLAGLARIGKIAA